MIVTCGLRDAIKSSHGQSFALPNDVVCLSLPGWTRKMKRSSAKSNEKTDAETIIRFKTFMNFENSEVRNLSFINLPSQFVKLS